MNNLKILVPLDNSPSAEKTIKALIALKDKIHGRLTLLHVFGLEKMNYHGVPEIHYEMVQKYSLQAAHDFIEKQKQIFINAGMQAEALVVNGSPRKVICQFADSGEYDLLVIGRHAEGEFRNLLFGSVSNYIMHNAKCPLMVL
jgi:nucleotide-binding universal stress UspA family protein